MDLIDRLIEHDDWANRQLLEIGRSLTDAQLDQEFDIGHRSLRETYDHVIFNIAVWTGLMVGKPIAPNRSELAPYDRSMAGLIDRYERFYADFAATARQARDAGRLDATFKDYFGGNAALGAGVVHVVLHNAEHRSEMLHIYQRLGLTDVPEIDHALWDMTVNAA